MPTIIAELEFPPISHILQWKDFGPGMFNKVALVNVLAVILTALLFFVAASKKGLVPKGIRNVAESGLDLVENAIAKDAIHDPHDHDAHKKFVPLLAALFFFIFFNNIFGVIPVFQMPATARMAVPMVLSLIVWLTFIIVGIVKQGPGHYFKGALFPPGVPKALYILVTPIELISTFLVRPFSLAVRLFANILAGHILLTTFGVLAHTLITAKTGWMKPIAVLPFIMLVIMTAFEIGVAFLQAYVFTLLTAVFIGGSVHPEH